MEGGWVERVVKWVPGLRCLWRGKAKVRRYSERGKSGKKKRWKGGIQRRLEGGCGEVQGAGTKTVWVWVFVKVYKRFKRQEGGG